MFIWDFPAWRNDDSAVDKEGLGTRGVLTAREETLIYEVDTVGRGRSSLGLGALECFREGTALEDAQTLLVMRVTANPSGATAETILAAPEPEVLGAV